MPNQNDKEFPKPLPLAKLLGPSFIILALGLGSGEIILWPSLVSKFGLGIAWGAFLGLTFQFFMNMEIERYALIKGESVFVGLAKLFRWAPYWFILSTFVAWAIPGIIAASAKVFDHIFGITDIFGFQSFKIIGIGFLILIGLILSSGTTVYGLVERITKFILLIGSPFILILAVILTKPEGWLALGKGIIGIGDGFIFLPAGIVIGQFLGAFAYAGAGGNLNLTQSIYVKEKGYGMGAYSQRISGFFKAKKDEKIKLSGEDFELNETNISRFNVWWKRINQEHLIVFSGIGLITILFLMLLSYNAAYQKGDLGKDIEFVLNEGKVIGQTIFPFVGIMFLSAVVIMLFQTQLGVLDSTSRIMAENLAVIKLKKAEETINLSRLYYLFLWSQIAVGILIFLLFETNPLQLVIIAAVLNAVAMFVHVGMVNWMNYKVHPEELQPGALRRLIMLGIFIFFGFFSVITIWIEVGKLIPK